MGLITSFCVDVVLDVMRHGKFYRGADGRVVRRLEAVIDFLVIRREWIVRSSPPLTAMSVPRPLAT